ncbi:MAG: hypothetical protein AB7O38_06665 [Pirellulaceae bacterium]
MVPYTLRVESEEPPEGEIQIWLSVSTDEPPSEHRHWLCRGHSFTEADIREALLATSWVRPHTGTLQVAGEVWHQQLADVVRAMLGYFVTSGVPRDELLTVHEAVRARAAQRGHTAEVPLWTCAWLDVLVRDDLAGEARRVRDIWTVPHLIVPCQAACERRLDAWLEESRMRAARLAERLAPSRHTRQAPPAREADAG